MRSLYAHATCGCSTARAGPHQQSSKHRGCCRLIQAKSLPSDCCAEIHQHHHAATTPISRRGAVLCSLITPLPLAAASWAGAAEPVAQNSNEIDAPAVNADALELFDNSKQQYRVMIPSSWERKDKAGADVLFEDPERRSTSVGVTVSPVRVSNIQQFGDLATVGQKLLEAERKKESTMNVELLAAAERQGANRATLYDYEYELDSTRGRKRIFNTVTITGSRLYILNGNFKCDKEAGCSTSDAAAPLMLLRRVAASFDAGSSS